MCNYLPARLCVYIFVKHQSVEFLRVVSWAEEALQYGIRKSHSKKKQKQKQTTGF